MYLKAETNLQEPPSRGVYHLRGSSTVKASSAVRGCSAVKGMCESSVINGGEARCYVSQLL